MIQLTSSLVQPFVKRFLDSLSPPERRFPGEKEQQLSRSHIWNVDPLEQRHPLHVCSEVSPTVLFSGDGAYSEVNVRVQSLRTRCALR